MFSTTTTAQQPSIFRMFYTHKRTQMLLESGWTNAQGVKVEGIKVKSVEKVSITKPDGTFYNCVHVIYVSGSGKRCSQFISCRAYLQRATEKRREESANYQAFQDSGEPSSWKVYPKANPVTVKGERAARDESNATKYRTVTTTPDGVTCDCEDWSNQADYLSQHPYLWHQVIKGYRICKHSLCTLNQLGFDSLGKYLKSWQPGGRLNNLAVTMNRTTQVRSA